MKLKGANGAVDPAGSRLAGEAIALAVGGFRILPAMGADLIESAPYRTQLTPLLIGRRETLLLGVKIVSEARA
ncbi:hypothetical protein GRI33_12065 [Brucella sp. BO3]|nr:hypothetical protein GRI33_12065 [Brucella sp. BO3]